MSKELVANPTPVTHPDILQTHTVSATNNSTRNVKSQNSYAFRPAFTPRNFAVVRDIKDHLDPIKTRGTQVNRKTVGQVVKENIPGILYYLIMGVLGIMEMGVIVLIIYTILPLAIAIPPIALLTFAFIGFGIDEFRKRLNEEPQPEPEPDKDFLFVKTNTARLKNLDIVDAHTAVIKAISNIHSVDNILLHNTDTFALANAYDAYIEMLVFVFANEDKLSPHLVDKYVQSLLNKAETVRCEAENVFDSIKTQEEFVRKATEESKRLQQEMVDSEAESIMPPD